MYIPCWSTEIKTWIYVGIDMKLGFWGCRRAPGKAYMWPVEPLWLLSHLQIHSFWPNLSKWATNPPGKCPKLPQGMECEILRGLQTKSPCLGNPNPNPNPNPNSNSGLGIQLQRDRPSARTMVEWWGNGQKQPALSVTAASDQPLQHNARNRMLMRSVNPPEQFWSPHPHLTKKPRVNAKASSTMF